MPSLQNYLLPNTEFGWGSQYLSPPKLQQSRYGGGPESGSSGSTAVLNARRQAAAPQNDPWSVINSLGSQMPQMPASWGTPPDPQLTPTSYLQSLMQLAPQVQPMNYGNFGAGAAQPPAAPAQPAAPAGPMNVTTGITQPQLQQPQMTPAGPPIGMMDMARGAYNSAMPQYTAPLQQQLMASYYPAQAGLTGAFEQAQAQAGQGWGDLGSMLQRLQSTAGTRQATGLLGLLGGMI